MDRLEHRATWWVSRAHLRSHALLQELFADVGARAYHYRLLAAVEEAGPISQADLGRATNPPSSSTTSATETSLRSSSVARAPHPSDRRRNVVSLTAAGRAELARLDAVVDQAQEQFLAPLTADERAVFLDLTRRVAVATD